MFFGHTSSNELGITAMSVRQENPVYMALACTDDMVRIYDRRYLTKPVFEELEGAQTTETAQPPKSDLSEENTSVALESYRGIVYMFSPSHMRMAANQERERYECKAIASGRRQHELPEQNDEATLAEYLEVGEPQKDWIESFRVHYGQEYASLASNWVSSANKITSLCYDPAGSGDLLISYSDERLYVIHPTHIRPYVDAGALPAEDPEIEREVSPNRKRQRQLSVSDMALQRPTAEDLSECSAFWPLYDAEHALNYDRDIMSAYRGHRNVQTMIKEARFFHYPGLSNVHPDPTAVRTHIQTSGTSAYVMSGSDDGHVFIWRKQTRSAHDQPFPVVSSPDFLLKGDSRIVNCLQPHPFVPFLACSGIDNDVKVFMPTGGYGFEVELFENRERVRAIEVLAERNRGAESAQRLMDNTEGEESETDGIEVEASEFGVRRLVVPASLLMRILGLTAANMDGIEAEDAENVE
jgi:WD40 repeat protein